MVTLPTHLVITEVSDVTLLEFRSCAKEGFKSWPELFLAGLDSKRRASLESVCSIATGRPMSCEGNLVEVCAGHLDHMCSYEG